jgi:hypothetical protein
MADILRWYGRYIAIPHFRNTFWVSWLQLFLFLTKVENVAEIPNTLIGYLLKKAIFALLKNKDEGRIKL